MRRLIDTEENERRRIARELHDGLGQDLAAIKLSLESFVTARRRHAKEAELAQLRAIIRRVAHVMEETRRVALALRPAMLDDLGAGPTIAWLCREFERLHRIETRLQMAVGDLTLEAGLGVAIYRICQEGLHNVAQHAHACRVDVTLSVDDTDLSLQITDDGRGLPSSPLPAKTGFGLHNMRERTEMTGGRFELKSVAGRGVTLRAVWPLAVCQRLDRLGAGNRAAAPPSREETREV